MDLTDGLTSGNGTLKGLFLASRVKDTTNSTLRCYYTELYEYFL